MVIARWCRCNYCDVLVLVDQFLRFACLFLKIRSCLSEKRKEKKACDGVARDHKSHDQSMMICYNCNNWQMQMNHT